MGILAKEFLTSLTEPKKESKEAEIKENSVSVSVYLLTSCTTQISCTSKSNIVVTCYDVTSFKGVLTVTKRKMTAAEEPQSPVTRSPRKKPRTDLPVNDSPRKKSLRPQAPADTNPVRSSPRKAASPATVPAKRETPKKSSAVREQKRGVAQVKQRGGVWTVKPLYVDTYARETKVRQTNLWCPCLC